MQPAERLMALRRTQRFINLIEALAAHGESSGGAVLIQPNALTMLCQVAHAANLYMVSENKWLQLQRITEMEEGLLAMAAAQREVETAAIP